MNRLIMTAQILNSEVKSNGTDIIFMCNGNFTNSGNKAWLSVWKNSAPAKNMNTSRNLIMFHLHSGS